MSHDRRLEVGPHHSPGPAHLDVLIMLDVHNALAAYDSGSPVLVGEVKWSRRVDWKREQATLRRRAENLPLARGRQVHLALWAPNPPRSRGDVQRFGVSQVLDALR